VPLFHSGTCRGSLPKDKPVAVGLPSDQQVTCDERTEGFGQLYTQILGDLTRGIAQNT